MTEHAEAGIGHNEPTAYDLDQMNLFQKKLDDFADAAGAWLDLGEIKDEAQAERLNDFITGGRQLMKQIEAQRMIDQKPHTDNVELVRSTWKRLTGPLQIAADRVKPMLSAWGAKKAAEAEALRKAEMEKAAAAEAEAQKKLDEAAKRHDVVGEAAAKEEAKAAAKETKAAARISTTGAVASATGGGRTAAMRTYYTARIDKPKMAVLWALANHPAEVDALLIKLAEAGKRGDKALEVPGVTFITDKRI